jgi:hypothetical protein
MSGSSLGSVLNIIRDEALAEFPGMRARRLDDGVVTRPIFLVAENYTEEKNFILDSRLRERAFSFAYQYYKMKDRLNTTASRETHG